MKNIFALALFLFLTQIIVAEDYTEFEGLIATTNGKALSYKIAYKINKDNTIEGYSITDIEGENFTKSLIKGQYNPSKSTLSFKETGNAFTKAKADESTFCFITSDNLKIKKFNGKILISGEFKGILPSGKVAAKGKIFLMESSTMKKIKLAASSIKNKSQKPTASTTKLKTHNLDSEDTTAIKKTIKSLSEEQKIVLMSNEKLVVECSPKNLSLDFWDGAYVDGDRISIYLNDNILVENVLLTASKRTIKLTPPGKSFKLKIVALNTGERGGNSGSFEVKDQNNVKPFISNLNKGESFEIEFRIK